MYIVHWSWSGSRDVGSSPQGSALSAGLGGGEVRGQSSLAVSAGAALYCCCGGRKVQLARGIQKSPTALGNLKNGSKAFTLLLLFEGVETKGSENETRLGAEGLLRQAVVSMATVPVPDGHPWRRGLLGVASSSLQGWSQLRETISSLAST